MAEQTPPLIAHILYRFAVGGLENGVVNLINRIPENQYRHVIISLTDSTDFKHRIKIANVEVYCLHKKPGHDIGLYWRLWKLLRTLKPDITHTRNLAALEMVIITMLAGVRRRVHSEHGWGMSDVNGTNRKYQLLRKTMSFFTHRYIGLSKHIVDYLHESAGIPSRKLTQIYNGVDADKFSSDKSQHADIKNLPTDFISKETIVIGTVGRMEPVKDQVTLAEAFIQLVENCESNKNNLRLIMVGEGDLRAAAQAKLDAAGLTDQVWLPGSLDNVSQLMNAMSIFALPSRNEGISNTILEAMASSLPVVATNVGGNPELVIEGETGMLVEAERPDLMMLALKDYVNDSTKRISHGQAASSLINEKFRLDHMVNNYLSVYDSLM